MVTTSVKTSVRSLNVIMSEIIADLQTQARTAKKPYEWQTKHYAAVPYLRALKQLDSVIDLYGCETGKDMIPYLLGNLTTWRGETAKRIKAELKSMIGLK
jgi:hypothetical protein